MERKNVKILHPVHGLIMDKEFGDRTQLKLFLDLVNFSLRDCTRLNVYDGKDFLINVPSEVICECIIFTY